MATPIPESGYADTTGIIALAILMVVVMLVGMVWGGRSPRMKKGPKK
jgi:predicted acyltransferase